MRSDVHKFGDRCRERAAIKSWCLRIRDSATMERTPLARSEQAGQGSKEMDKKRDEIAHRRIVAGREIPRKYGQNNNSPATSIWTALLKRQSPIQVCSARWPLPTSAWVMCRASLSMLHWA